MGDFELLGELERVRLLATRIAEIGSEEFRRELCEEMSQAALDFVAEEFAMSRDPYGMPWAPLKKARFGAGPLVKSGKLQGRMRRRVSFDGFTLRAGVDYGGYHQGGTKKMVARPFFPGEELPAQWAQAFERIAEDAIARAMARVT